ncbi:MAG: toxic anion resistance protein [Micavibrio sp.]|nr:toxic anion resistance protein [Micavibrio sp.]
MLNKKQSIEENFNRMADQPAESEADQNSRRNRTRGKVVDYVDADPETKAEMEKIMDPIDRNPDSFEAIIGYGHPPLDRLGKIANDMIKMQGRFNDQVNVMAGALGQLETGLKGLNFDKFGEATQKLLKGMVGGGVKGVKGVGKFGKDLWDGLTGKAAKRTEDEKLVKEMQDALPEMLFEMIKLVDNIQKTEIGIKEVMKEAEKLGVARVEATREISLYLGASKEVMRRYNEEYIPQAKETLDETNDPEDEMYMKDVMKRKEDFIDRVTVLEGSRAQSVIAAQQLRQMMETMEDQRKKIQDIMYNSQNEWKAMLAAAGIAGSSLKAAQTIAKADAFGDKMHDQTMKMIEEAHTMTQNSKSRGTIDPQKLIEASDRLQKLIERENDDREKRLKQLEATAVQLRGATDKLIEAADSSNQARMLEAVKSAEDDAKKARTEVEGRRPTNDNKDKTVEPQAQPAAALEDDKSPATEQPASRRPARKGPTP